MRRYGNFGTLVEAYDKARPGYPTTILRQIIRATGKKHPRILDLGCGTGISSRLLAKHGAIVVGIDIDPAMLAAAKRHRSKNVKYVRASASKLPFPKETFDAVTAFSAFHWFANDAAMGEIRRVLKKNGIFSSTGLKKGSVYHGIFKKLVKKFSGHWPKTNRGIAFRRVLRKNGFKGIRGRAVRAVNTYILKKFLLLPQSYSPYNYVPKEKREAFLDSLRTRYEKDAHKGRIREVTILQFIIAQKS